MASLLVVSTVSFVSNRLQRFAISSSSVVVGSWVRAVDQPSLFNRADLDRCISSGIRDIKGLYGLPHLAINLWIVGVFTLAVTIVNLPLGFIEHSLTPLWIAVCASFCFITFFVS